jgi:hypothetical protein
MNLTPTCFLKSKKFWTLKSLLHHWCRRTTCFDQHWSSSGVSKIAGETAVLLSVPSSLRPCALWYVVYSCYTFLLSYTVTHDTIGRTAHHHRTCDRIDALFGFFPLSSILGNRNTTFRKLDLFPSSSEEGVEDTYSVGPLEKLEYRTMEKVQKPSNSVCYTPSSETFRTYGLTHSSFVDNFRVTWRWPVLVETCSDADEILTFKSSEDFKSKLHVRRIINKRNK